MDNRDRIDWGKTNISKLYLKILIPTLIGMISVIAVTIVDGYVGSNALAAVNIAVPLFLISTAFALMFGVGSSVVTSVHLSQGKIKAARINVTQAIIVSEILFTIFSILIFIYSEKVSYLLGSTDLLFPMVNTYIRIISLSLIFYMLQNIGLFLIRLDGSPKYAMMCSLVPAIINIVGDYILIAHYQMGIKGAVIATAGSLVIGGIMALTYMIFAAKTLKLYKLKTTIKSLQLTLRNISYMCRLGLGAFLGEMAIALMMLVGNYIFLEHYGEDGIAAFGVICYYFPIIFMINNAISQSGQPIISYNHGARLHHRVKQTFRLTIIYATGFATLLTIAIIFFAPTMVSLFLDSSYPAHKIASQGYPYFASGFIFFAINMMYLGYYQSIEDYKTANKISLLRGYILLLICFYLMPELFGTLGVWLAVPAAELITVVYLLLFIVRRKRK